MTRGCGFSCCCCPSHEWRDPADYGTHPGVDDGEAFHRGVHESVDADVSGGEEGYGGVGAVVEESEAGSRSGDSEEEGRTGCDELADKGAVTGPRHEGIVGWLE